jgi:hypothetical protein
MSSSGLDVKFGVEGQRQRAWGEESPRVSEWQSLLTTLSTNLMSSSGFDDESKATSQEEEMSLFSV